MSPPKTFSESKLFTPLQIGEMGLQHRIIMAPLTRLRAAADHVILPMAKEYYAQRASTPGTLLIAESNLISPRHSGAAHMPGIWTQEQIAAWKEVVEAVHAQGSYIFLQLVALGRVADEEQLKKEGGFPVVGASAIPFRGTGIGEGVVVRGSTPHALTQDEIRLTVEDFVQAARNGLEAGFDGIEIHGANGYLVDQFLQDASNQRNDSYGGSVENRARLALEVATAVSEAIGKERLGFRISPFSTFQGMKMGGKKPVEQFSYLTQKLKDLDLAYLHIIESRVVNNVDCEKTEGIEAFLRIWGREKPVLIAGGFDSERAREAAEGEYKDYNVGVVFGRWFISNPDLVFRVRHGLELNRYERDTFYAVEQERGYLDYSFSEEWKKEHGVCMNGKHLTSMFKQVAHTTKGKNPGSTKPQGINTTTTKMLRIIAFAMALVLVTMASPLTNTNTSIHAIQGVPKDLKWRAQLVNTPDSVSIGETADPSTPAMQLSAQIWSVHNPPSPKPSTTTNFQYPSSQQYNPSASSTPPTSSNSPPPSPQSKASTNTPPPQTLSDLTVHWQFDGNGGRKTFREHKIQMCCLEGFMGVVDRCEGEMEKQGGAARDACLLWIVDMSPQIGLPKQCLYRPECTVLASSICAVVVIIPDRLPCSRQVRDFVISSGIQPLPCLPSVTAELPMQQSGRLTPVYTLKVNLSSTEVRGGAKYGWLFPKFWGTIARQYVMQHLHSVRLPKSIARKAKC
ncbi:hypothetical protein AC579_7398 [Pseudocercospora musae]|uniref:NADH:flavin oxidoreductase/NADH oxidase N-terminal domain-containing protein n=1 Tax=Pseudocercospora musae TaxID=113226 RepID=A0A139IQC1_9PEZI|nr:hypothetical protein AC579_7398 [Pseudocercospora musae]